MTRIFCLLGFPGQSHSNSRSMVLSCSIPVFSRPFHWSCQWPLPKVSGPLSCIVILTQSEGRQLSQHTTAGKGSYCPKPHLCYSFPCSFGLDHQLEFCLLFPPVAAGTETLFYSLSCLDECTHPSQGLSLYCE